MRVGLYDALVKRLQMNAREKTGGGIVDMRQDLRQWSTGLRIVSGNDPQESFSRSNQRSRLKRVDFRP